jgi:ATP-dependent exoDNAse (exonuclease V) beta subunit
MRDLKPLKIFKASAGSGKTYKLVQTYLKLILKDSSNLSYFSSVMAMTFTNKAAFEMKHRIIAALNDISNFDKLDEDLRSKTKLKISELQRDLACTEKEVIDRANKTLKNLLHRYEEFHVMTIDKFNLRLIRAFAKELDLPVDSKIVLNEDEVLSEIIEKLMDGLDESISNAITKLIITYAKEKLQEEETWNFQSQLRAFATILTNEKYFEQIEHLITKDYSSNSYATLKNELITLENEFKNRAKLLYETFKKYDVKELPGASTTGSAFEKLMTDKLLEKSDNLPSFFSSSLLLKMEEGTKKASFPEELKEQALRFNHFFEQNSSSYFSQKENLKNFYNMALLQFIYVELETVKETDKIVRISEFNKLISKLIQDESAPFIYEKIGTKFRHFLLDEFQDTSRLQWQNIVPLLMESLGSTNENLIVGDAKQSIYRFKNGIAEQFISLPKLYNPEQKPKTALDSSFFEAMGEKDGLKDNYRSFQNIVAFNNLFFTEIQEFIPLQNKEYYDDVNQNPKGKQGGYIEIISEECKNEAKEKCKSQLLVWVEQLIQEGYNCGDICILGNKKKECNDWAIELSSLYKVVSDDSLLVHSDQFVKLTIAFFSWRIRPSGELEAKRFAELYFSSFYENPIEKITDYWKTYVNKEGKNVTIFDVSTFINDTFGSQEEFLVKYDSLYGLLQWFYKKMKLNELTNAYLHHLSDMVFDFDNLFGPNIEKFVEEYLKNGKNTAIKTPENNDAIKIMTGHKSKGLEFPVVILPNVDFSINSTKAKYLLEDHGNFIYTGLSEKSPIESVKIFTSNEKAQNFMDKLNLTYVMMTRPIERLYIGNYYASKEFGNTFHKTLEKAQLKDANLIRNSNSVFTVGEKNIKSEPILDNTTSHNFTPISVTDNLWFPEISLNTDILDENFSLNEAIRFGNQLHELLAEITAKDQIQNTFNLFLQEGKIENEFVLKLTEEIEKIFAFEAYTDLFLDAKKVTNEQSIIIGPNETKRPDKIIFKENETIVLDYKTGLSTKKNEKQVAMYKKVLSEMNYPNVKGYLFYTTTLTLQEV